MTHRESQPTPAPDAILLEEFVKAGSEDAFRQLVEKYLGMMMGIALRRTGDQSQSEEIVQNVFAVLARKAGRLKATPTLAGWLYRATAIECVAELRKERSRAERIKRIMENARLESEGESIWREALPVLDEAIETLPPKDRDMILMRFWEKRSFREIGELTGKSEGATQKQTERAVGRLGRALRRRGIAISIPLLMAGFPPFLAQAAPAGLAAAISKGALASASELTTGTLILKSIEAMTYAKTKSAIAVAVIAAVPIGMQWDTNRDLSEKVNRLEEALTAAQAAGIRDAPQTNGESAPQSDNSPAAPAAASPPDSATGDGFLSEWERALGESDPMKRSLWISRLIGDLTVESAPMVAEIFERARKSGARHSEEQALFMRAWGGLDGPAAVEYEINRTGDAIGSPTMLSAVAGWASNDPEAARAWVEMFEDGQRKEDIIFGLLDGWATTHIEGASRYAESRPRTPARNRIRQMLLERVLMEGGIPAAREWFEGVSGEGHNKMYKMLGFDELIGRILQEDPAQAATWIREEDGKPFLGGRAIRNTAIELARISPTDALDWVLSLENLKDGQWTSSLSHVMSSWAALDPNAAGTWLNENSQHPQYDAMANRFILTIAEIDPEAGMAWASSITNEKRRHNSMLIAGAGLLAQKGENAIPELKAAGFTDEMIEQAPLQSQWARANFYNEKAQLMTVPAGEYPFESP